MSKVYLGQASANWWTFFVDNLNGLSAVASSVPAEYQTEYQTLLTQGATLYETVQYTATMDVNTATATIKQIAVPIQDWFNSTYEFSQAIGAGGNFAGDYTQGMSAAKSFFTSLNATNVQEFLATLGNTADSISALSEVPVWAWGAAGLLALILILE